MMDALLQSQRPLGTIVHIGAGHCTELEAYQLAGAERIVLVEPNPEAINVLRRKAVGQLHIDVLPFAITAGEAGDAHLHLLSVPGLSSLARPTGLFALYPAIRVVEQLSVDTLSIQQLLDQSPLPDNKRNWLIIDAPGLESQLVSALAGLSALHRFGTVLVCCGRDEHYELAAPADNVLGALESQGYAPQWMPAAQQDPDRPCYYLYRDPVRLENAWLRQTSEETRHSLEYAEQELNSARKEIQTLQQELSELRKWHAKAEILENEQRCLRASIEQKDAELAAARSDVAVALRLQSLREADLKDLQQRYAELREAKLERDDLLAQVTQRLDLAAEYLHQLKGQGMDEQLRETLEGAPAPIKLADGAASKRKPSK
ncbi:MAG: hypothetical protein JJU06_03470 [Ectothiorhodospiraceae bacterium]|nr:hypothetical protein [Ectothiorhodospiraceae bacterium]